MKVIEHDGQIEREVVTAFITSPEVLARWADRWQNGLCESPQANVVLKLCVRHYRKYNKAPGDDIRTIFSAWAEANPNHHAVELTSSYLGGLSQDYEGRTDPQNTDYLCDLASKHFVRVKARKLIEDLRACLLNDELDKITSKIEKYHVSELSDDTGIDLLQDRTYGKDLFSANRHESLIDYPGKLGVFFGSSLRRGSFISLLAGEKVGKTFWLMDLAWRAMLQRRKVVFFGVGDMTMVDMLERFYSRAAERPIQAATIEYPVQIAKGKQKGDPVKVIRETRKFVMPMDFEEACKSFEAISKIHLRSDKSFFRLYFHPNSTCTVAMISSELSRLQRKGFVADVVVIDYADILAAPPGVQEYREQINENWKAMRKLSQEHQVCLVTATQAPARSYGAARLGKQHFSDDKRKRAHVTGEVGINQTEEEEEQGLYRLAWTVRRSERKRASLQVYTAACLSIMNPAVLNCL